MIDHWHHIASLLPFEWAQFAFMRNALLAVLIVAPLYAMLGTFVVSRRMSFFSDAIGHAALTGLGIGVILRLSDPLWGVILIALLMAIGIVFIQKWSRTSSDTVIGIFMSFAVALGIVILSRGGQFSKYVPFLIGDLLSITPSEIFGLFVAFVVTCMLCMRFYNHLLVASLNSSLAASRHIPIFLYQIGFAVVLASIVALNIQWVGVMVINSLLILPAAAARNIARNARQYFWYSILISMISSVAGLISSYYLSTATGATIVLFSVGFFAGSLAWKRLAQL